jgi:hypothetical protein
MKATALTLTAAAAALAAAALLPAVPASAALSDAPQSIPAQSATTQSTSTQSIPTHNVPEGDWGIKASIIATDVGLKLTDWQTQSDAGYQPGDVNAGGGTRFFVTSDGYGHGVSGDATYRIYNGSAPTGYYVHISVGDRTTARQTSDCTVTLGDPNAQGTVPAVSPYSCEVTDNGGGLLGSEWFLGFAVHRADATVISDPMQQHQYLLHCTAANCAYVAASKQLYTGAELAYGSPYTNTSTHSSTMTVGQKTEISNTTSFGTTLSSSVDVGGVWSAGVALTYNDSWTYTSSFSQSEQIELDPGQTGWFTIAPQMLKVTGDFYVQYNGKLYLIPNTTVNVPSAAGVTHVFSYTQTPGHAAVQHKFQ